MKNPTLTESISSLTPSSDALPEPIREGTVRSIDNVSHNLANRQSILGDLPGCGLQAKVEPMPAQEHGERDLQVATEKILSIDKELQTKHRELTTVTAAIQATTKELRYRTAQLERVNTNLTERTHDDFLSNLSHKLRNPPTAIIGWAQLLQTHKLAKTTVTPGLEAIYRNAKVQSQSIDELFNLSQLPLKAVTSDLALVAKETSAIVTQDVSLLEGLHILAVDDEPYILDLVKYILEDAGAEVTTVTSTKDAISSLVTSGIEYDALLSDIGMPNEDGFALIRQVRALATPGRQIPAAAITADASERQRQQAIAAGFQVHLAKPFYAAQLIQMVANLMTINN